MAKLTEVKSKHYTGERALFQAKNLHIIDSVFDDGESPLKESENIVIDNGTFGWKYPLWYSKNIKVRDSRWTATGRAGVWYTDNIDVSNTEIDGAKNFRRCNGISLTSVTFTNAEETLWQCNDVKLKHVKTNGAYFAMNCNHMEIDDFELDGNYGFDGAKNVIIRNAKLVTKDAFWNSENVTIYNSFISGEYIGWNSKNMTLVNCTIESLQGFCYIDKLKLVNCKLLDTTLAFEYCKNINADVCSSIDSVKNPISGKIIANTIDELIMEPDKIDITKTKIICRGIK